MIYDLVPTGPKSASVIRINNTQALPITVELQAEQRVFDQNGKETRTPADEKFVLFPPQAIVQPGATQAVRVQYVGPQHLQQSETYTVTVRQIPVQLPSDGKSGVQFVFNFSTVANIVPSGAKATIEPVSVEPNDQTVTLILRNTGTKYANLSQSSISLSGPGFATEIKNEAWRKALGTGWILPGGTRIVELPKPRNTPKQLTAKFNFVDPQN